MSAVKQNQEKSVQSQWASEEKLRDLMILTQQGDKVAYEELLRELNTLVLAYCMKALPGQVLALDCRQDVLLSLHRMLHTYDPKRSFFAWLYTIIRNKVIDYYRKNAQARSRESSTVVEIDSLGGVSSHEQSEAQMEAASLLSRLSKEFREPLVLSKLYGYSNREIAVQLNISESLVKIRVFRGLKKLKAILKEETQRL